MPNSNFYLVRPYPNNVARINEFKETGFVAIGWSEAGDISGMNKDELRDVIKEYCETCDANFRSTFSTFKIFSLDLKIGDYIFAPESDMGPIHVGKVTGGYFYNPAARNLDFAHQREVEWISEPIPRSKVEQMNNPRLVGAFKFPGSAAKLEEYRLPLISLIQWAKEGAQEPANEPPTIPASQLVRASYPLRLNVNCDVSFPSDMTTAEAERFAKFVSTLTFEPGAEGR